MKPLGYQKIEKLENENVSLEFQVQSLIKERENNKMEYQKLFDSIKKTRTWTQREISELIENVNQKTYAYADVRSQNQHLLITISELKSKLKDAEKTILWFVDSGCSKHMTGNLKLLKNFIEKFIGTIRFENYHFAAITGYGDDVHGNITICHVYYVKGIRHNLILVGQFYDDNLEVAFRSNTCYVHNLEEDDLLTGPETNRFNNEDLSAESNQTLPKEDFNNLFCPMYEEYFEKRSPEVSINSVAPTTTLHDNVTPSPSSVTIEETKAPPLVYSSKEQISLVLTDVADESFQEDSIDLDGNNLMTPFTPTINDEDESSSTVQDPSNMYELTQVHPSTHMWKLEGEGEKFEGGFEQDIDNEGEKDREDEDGDSGVS
ncbi:hypothetical protein Tco_0886895 [Tanacetum coccineum]